MIGYYAGVPINVTRVVVRLTLSCGGLSLGIWLESFDDEKLKTYGGNLTIPVPGILYRLC